MRGGKEEMGKKICVTALRYKPDAAPVQLGSSSWFPVMQVRALLCHANAARAKDAVI